MAPKPLLFGWGPRYGPQAPKCSGRPGGAVAALYIADSPRIVVAALRHCQDSSRLQRAGAARQKASVVSPKRRVRNAGRAPMRPGGARLVQCWAITQAAA